MFKQYLSLPRAVHVLCVGVFINRAGTLLVVFLTLYLREQLGFDPQFATWAMGAFGLGAMMAVLVGGHLADAIGRRTVMLLALVGGGFVLVVFPQLTSRPAVMIGVALFAFLSDMYRPAAQAMIADLVESDNRSHAFGLMYLAINVGFAVAPFIGGALAEIDFDLIFYVDAATAAIYAAIILLFIRETLPSRQKAADNPDAEAPQIEDNVSTGEFIRHVLRDRVFICFCCGTLLVALVYMQAMSTLPLYLQAQGFSATDYGHIIATNGIMITCLQLPLVSVFSRFHRGTLLVVAAVITGAGFGCTALADAKWHYMLTVLVWTTGEIMAAPFSAAIVSDLAPLRMRARYMGVFSTSFCSANMIGAPLGGMVLTHWGGNVLWTATLAGGITSAVMFSIIHRHVGQARDNACKTCGYKLRGRPESHCPSCGAIVASDVAAV